MRSSGVQVVQMEAPSTQCSAISGVSGGGTTA